MRASCWGTKEGRGEVTVYLTVAAILLVAGALLRTVVLNWLVGPAVVVLGVSALSALVGHRRADR